MNEIFGLNPDSMTAEVAYRRTRLTPRPTFPDSRGLWWRRRAPRAN